MESNNTTNTAKSNNTSLSYEDVIEKLEAISIKLESYNDFITFQIQKTIAMFLSLIHI